MKKRTLLHRALALLALPLALGAAAQDFPPKKPVTLVVGFAAGGAADAAARLIAKKLSENIGQSVAVSYTHLDVYKRQREAYTTTDIDGQLRGLVLQNISNAIASSGIAFLDLASNQLSFAQALTAQLLPEFAKLGLKLEGMTVQNVSLPEELQKLSLIHI